MRPLTNEELQRPRAASEFLSWVEQLLAEIASTKQGKSDIRFARGLRKQLVEEIFPLGLFALHHYQSSPDVIITPILGNQAYDARVADKRENKSPIEFIEVTQSHEGVNEYLRMLVLESEGHVNVLGRVKKSGTKATGFKIEVENEAKNHRDVLHDEVDRIEDALRRKTKKMYPPDTALLIIFDDYIAIQSPEDKAVVSNLVLKYLPDLRGFSWISLVGWSKRTFLEYDNSIM